MKLKLELGLTKFCAKAQTCKHRKQPITRDGEWLLPNKYLSMITSRTLQYQSMRIVQVWPATALTAHFIPWPVLQVLSLWLEKMDSCVIPRIILLCILFYNWNNDITTLSLMLVLFEFDPKTHPNLPTQRKISLKETNSRIT